MSLNVPKRTMLATAALTVIVALAGAGRVAASNTRSHLFGAVRLVLRTDASSPPNTTTTSNSPGSGSGLVTHGSGGSGTFTIRGAIHDMGSFSLSGPPPPPPGSPPSTTLVCKLTGKRGSLRLAVTASGAVTESAGSSNTLKGGGSSAMTWRILSGTGAYAHLLGSGKGKQTRQLITLTGHVRST